MTQRYTALRTASRTALIMVVFTFLFTALMAGTYRYTSPRIAESEHKQRMALINAIVAPEAYDNELLEDYVVLPPTPELGLDRVGHVYRARLAGEPSALVLEAVAPDGYAGRIQLAVAVSTEGTVSGVRVTGHAETPGLGDYIDPQKDRNRDAPWIEQFSGVSYEDIPPRGWTVTRDGGEFSYRAGATISARAVIEATGRAVRYALAHQDTLFDAETGSQVQIEVAP